MNLSEKENEIVKFCIMTCIEIFKKTPFRVVEIKDLEELLKKF